jgi:PAS domain S-box-containing protein
VNLREFRRVLQVTLLLPLLLSLLLAGLLAWQIERTLADQGRIDHSDRITAQLNEVERLIGDEDGGLHGYQLSRDQLEMTPFQSTNRLLRDAFNRLTALVKGDPDEELRTRQLRDSYSIWLGFAKQIQGNLKANSAANDPSLDMNERQAMDTVRGQIGSMLQIEAARRQQRRRTTATQVRRLMTVLAVSSITVGFLLGVVTQRNLKRVLQAFRASLDDAHRRTDELFESRQWLQTTLDSLGDALIACNREGYVKFMNPVAQQLTGWSLAEADGRPLVEIFRIEDNGPVSPAQNLVGMTESANASEPPRHTVLQQRDGGKPLIDYKASPILGSSGEVTGTVVVFRDVSEQRNAEAALLANEKLAVAGRLAASIAHEIHNPLDAVANLHYLMERENDPAQQQRYLAMAQQELARTLQISRAMLGLYREPRTPVTVNVRELLESVLLLLDRRLKNQSIRVERVLETNVTVEGFPGELRQVFTNLITNAADAAGLGGRISVRLRTGSSVLNGHNGATVTITDSGTGVPEEVKGKLFRPFFTTKGEQGTGLGLWVSRGIVEKHGGTLEIANSTEVKFPGAAVNVYLPAHAFQDSERKAEEPVSHS